jgi:hypothetical protein
MEPFVGAAVKYAKRVQSLAIITDDFQATAHIMTTFIIYTFVKVTPCSGDSRLFTVPLIERINIIS